MAGFPNLWSAVSRSIDDLTRRLKVTATSRMATPNPAAFWRPPALQDMAQAAGYWMVNYGDGPRGFLEVGPGTDREQVRAWLLDWLRQLRTSVIERGPSLGASAAFWFGVNADGEALSVRQYGFGAGPPGSVAVPPADLVDAAIADLSAVA